MWEGVAVRSITIQNIPDGLYARLMASAERNQHSLQKEIIAYLERELPTLPGDDQGFWHRLEDRIARWRAAGLTPASAEEIRLWKQQRDR